MNWKKFVADYLSFTRRDRIAIITIILLVIAIFFMPNLISPASSKPVPPDTTWIAAMRRIEQQEALTGEPKKYADHNSNTYPFDRSAQHYSRSKGELFYFDPNTLSLEGWKRLGIRDKTIGTIQNYTSKGGKFKKPADLQRIYGLYPDEYERLAPYVKIESTGVIPTSKDFTGNSRSSEETVKTYVAYRYTSVDINLADTTDLIALPGIGGKLATRIINFRNKLGGFYSISQVGETFGLPDSTFQKIKQYLKLESSAVRKININTATIDELKSHPYIRYGIANPIIAYRDQHGPFANLHDIKKVMTITDEIYNKVAPYLVTQ